MAFLLLAIAGLSYLMPRKYIDRLETMPGVRIFLVVFFFVFGSAAIIINAVNREEQDFKSSQQATRQAEQTVLMGTVMKSVTNIQDALKPKSVDMSEAERKQHLITALRDEYILQNNPIDEDILAGNKMPPQEWMNKRLREQGESWTVKDQPVPATQQIIQLPVEEKQAKIEFSFSQKDQSDPAKTVQFGSLMDGKVTFSISAIVRGETAAKNLHIWIRECVKCEWIPPIPPGFSETSSEQPYDKIASPGDVPPNVGLGKWNFVVKVAEFPLPNGVPLACYYTCTNCAPIDWKRPQTLWVTPNWASFKLHSPSIVYTPEPVPK